MRPFLAVANLNDGGFAVVAIDPTKRVGNGCSAIVQSIHVTRGDAETAIRQLAASPTDGREGHQKCP